MLDPTQWIDGMLGAVTDEIAQLKRPGSEERILLTDGRRIGASRDSKDQLAHYLFEFAVPVTTRIPGLLGGDLTPDGAGRPLTAVVESWPGPGRVRLWVPTDLGSGPVAGDLAYRSDQALHAIWSRLKELRDPLEDQIVALFGAVGRHGEIPTPSASSLPEVAALNAEQQLAVRRALAAPVSRIWGPPGTGKTGTASALARACIRQGRRLILAGPTHRAVDLLLLRLLRELQWDPEEMSGRIVRVGDIRHPDLYRRWGRTISLDAIQETQAAKSSSDPVPTFADLIHRAEVVAATTHQVALGRLPRMDVLVLDEASMVPLPLGLLASLHARTCVLVGDPRQLGPVVKARTSRARRWLGTAVLQPPRASSGGLPEMVGPCTMLTRQYRMPSAVCGLVSHMSYEGRLITAGAAVESCESESSRSRPALAFVCASELPDRALGAKGEGRRFENPAQARLVMRVVHDLIRSGGCSDATRIAVIAPYRAHVRALTAKAKEIGLSEHVTISTVHRFQGEEFPHVVLSLPERKGERLSGFLRASKLSDDGGRLLTVAASRASEQLIVVGHLPWLARRAPAGGPLERFLTLLRCKGVRLTLKAAGGNSDSSRRSL